MRILVVENDAATGRILVNGLKAEQFAVDLVQDGEEGLLYMCEVNYDLVILKLDLPKLDGLSVLERARKRQRNVPVLILSERTTVEDRVIGLEAGADRLRDEAVRIR